MLEYPGLNFRPLLNINISSLANWVSVKFIYGGVNVGLDSFC